MGQTGSIQYNYSTTQNNGQITGLTRTLNYPSATSETIGYTYDALKRLTSAVATPGSGSATVAWNDNFTYDGFGNLTSKALTTGGTTTTNTIPVDPTTNRLTSSYDLNGNMLTRS
jgi:YD repeat-containing protein